ncbi:hypothetical protein GCM10011586_27010 [Silvibacterium dinghuense]|nr:hypothetical protein GCM10011586_27010 [Silvibacterium dinghuense]
MIARTAIVDEEEEPVTLDGATESAAELILRKRIDGNLWRGLVVGPGVGIEAVILHIAISRAVELVGSALQHTDL